MKHIDLSEHWTELQALAKALSIKEPALMTLLNESVLERASFSECLVHRITRKLVSQSTSIEVLREAFKEAFEKDPEILQSIAKDMLAVQERDPACLDILSPLLYFKGFHALICYRLSHQLWKEGRKDFAIYLQSLISERFSVDIHPAARIGSGILLDHATSFVAGETAVIEDNVSILHEVTLGGTGKDRGDRHPKIKSGVLLGAGAKVLGNVTIGEGAKVGAGSVVLKDVPAQTSSLSTSPQSRQSSNQSHSHGDEGDEGREGCRPPEGDEGHEEVKSPIFAGKKA
jgi:serine O-acetyltransferase